MATPIRNSKKITEIADHRNIEKIKRRFQAETFTNASAALFTKTKALVSHWSDQ